MLEAKLLSVSGKIYTERELEEIKNKATRSYEFYNIKINSTANKGRPKHMLKIKLASVSPYFLNENKAVRELVDAYDASFGLIKGEELRLYFDDEDVEFIALRTGEILRKHKLQGYVNNELEDSDI